MKGNITYKIKLFYFLFCFLLQWTALSTTTVQRSFKTVTSVCIYEDKWWWWSEFNETATACVLCCPEGKSWKTRLEFIIEHFFVFLTANGSFSLGSINQSRSINQGLNNSITLQKILCFQQPDNIINFNRKLWC